jgi:metal transporter CNNM
MQGKPSAFFTLVLQGKVLVCVGSEGFESQLGPWSYMGIK